MQLLTRNRFQLEHFQKCCSHSGGWLERAVFLGFGFVSAQLQGFSNLCLRRSLAKAQKSSLRIAYDIFSNALVNRSLKGLWFVLFFSIACPAFAATTFTASVDRTSIILGEQV